MDPNAANLLLLYAMLVLGLFSLGGGLLLMALSLGLRHAFRHDPQFKEPRNEC